MRDVIAERDPLAIALATWFGCGFFPWGPGTIGSLAAVLIAAFLTRAGAETHLILFGLTGLLLLPAIWAATKTALWMQKKDPGLVVIDEVLGQWVTLLGASVLNWKSLAAGFLLFRVFDIWKPWPVRILERLPGGIGIVTDDLAAGVYAALILYVGGVLKLY
jgi:phosphatidylglycerophosphatase A